MTRPRRVCHVVSSLHVGGAETVAIRLAKAQEAAGQSVTLLSLRDGALAASCAELSLRTRVLAPGPMWKMAAEATLFFARERFDVVNTHNPPAHKFGLLSRAVGRPVLAMTLHGEASRSYGRLLSAPLTDGVIACSARVKDAFFVKHPGYDERRMFVVENGVDTARVPGGVDALAGVRKDGERIVVIVARLDPIKDIGTLVRAFASLDPPARKARLVLVGDGPTRAELEALTQELGIAPHVSFLGFRSDVAEILAASDLFALSSITEGMPLAALEAMSAGIPVVATAVGGTPEVVDDGVTGLLVPPRDPSALSKGLARLLDDDVERRAMGEAAKERVERRFSLRATTERYLATYDILRARKKLLRSS